MVQVSQMPVEMIERVESVGICESFSRSERLEREELALEIIAEYFSESEGFSCEEILEKIME